MYRRIRPTTQVPPRRAEQDVFFVPTEGPEDDDDAAEVKSCSERGHERALSSCYGPRMEHREACGRAAEVIQLLVGAWHGLQRSGGGNGHDAGRSPRQADRSQQRFPAAPGKMWECNRRLCTASEHVGLAYQ